MTWNFLVHSNEMVCRKGGVLCLTTSTFCSLFSPQLNQMLAQYKVMWGCECCISAKSIHFSLLSWRNRYFFYFKIKAKMLKTEGLVKKHITYMRHIKIQSCHMDVIFMPKHLIWHKLQFAHILSLIMHWHNGNLYCGVVLIFLV